jgi:general L-amino acid transport system substrate-binding protein
MTAKASWFLKSPKNYQRYQAQRRPQCACNLAPPLKKNLNDYSKVMKLNMKPVVFDTQEATNKAYFAGRCQAYTTGRFRVWHLFRNKEATNPDDHLILPELIFQRNPLGPSVRRGDDEFFAIVKWVALRL